MGYRMVCDQCDNETPTNYVGNRATVTLDGWKVEVQLVSRHDQVLNTLVLCEDCFHKVLVDGKLSQTRWA